MSQNINHIKTYDVMIAATFITSMFMYNEQKNN